LTLIVCIKFEKGVLLATDSREVFGAGEPLMRESQRKIEILNEKYCLVGAWMVGAIERVLEDIREQFNRLKIDDMRAFVDLCEDLVFRYFKVQGKD